jgi:tRNA pseudouridine32 synthase / 23S rRNA pseudouridine746 synthase
MYRSENCFTTFKQSIAGYALPERFTFPFYYQPHPLALLAVKELQQQLTTQTQWQHNFGLLGDKENAIGKMFGVLLVANQVGEVGYLTAFSGKLAEQSQLANFVPPVFDMLTKESFFLSEQLIINQVSEQLNDVVENPQIVKLTKKLNEDQDSADRQIKAQQQLMVASRKSRKSQRAVAELTLCINDFALLNSKLSRESIAEKNQLKTLKLYWQNRLDHIKQPLQHFHDEITQLKNRRKNLSNALQKKLFAQYRFLNKAGEEKDLTALFKENANPIPPAGSGECAAPKLLHYAFRHQLKPLALAEFWWGESPKSEIRQHQNFYPACQGKCQPILAHMLEGMAMDDNPLLVNPAKGKHLAIVYQDDDLVVLNKPAEFLSVPGKNITDSVYSRIKQQFPQATGPLIVHRLDMSTSGLMVIALTKRAHKNLQQQFINRTVNKRYIALIDGILTPAEGHINLPLRVDLDDRPRQLVCEKYGKIAETTWQLIGQNVGENKQQSKVYLYPKTGRTHQLRVHCAHVRGLNMPIVGDDLYGKKAKRLHLHAQLLAFTHPITKQPMNFTVDADF